MFLTFAPHIVHSLAIGLGLMSIASWGLRYVVYPRWGAWRLRQRASVDVQQAVSEIQQSDRARWRWWMPNRSGPLLYGEVNLYAFADMLAWAQPQPGESLIDLGCGAGQAVLLASQLYDWSSVVGVELREDLYGAAEQLYQSIKSSRKTFQNRAMAEVMFFHQDFLTVDLSPFNIVFINATAFTGDLWQAILGRLSFLKSGARVIVSSQTLPSSRYSLLVSERCLMSWGLCHVRVYRVV